MEAAAAAALPIATFVLRVIEWVAPVAAAADLRTKNCNNMRGIYDSRSLSCTALEPNGGLPIAEREVTLAGVEPLDATTESGLVSLVIDDRRSCFFFALRSRMSFHFVTALDSSVSVSKSSLDECGRREPPAESGAVC